MKEDVIQHSGKPTPAHCSVVCAPAGVVLVEPARIKTLEQVHDLIVMVDIPSTEKPHQDIKQRVIDALTMLVLPPSINEIIICSHGDNINPDIVCDQETPWSEPTNIDIPEVITPIPVNNYNPTHNQQIRYRNNAFENLLNQQFLHHKNKHDNTIFFYPNIKNK